jgi:hypothetical protein
MDELNERAMARCNLSDDTRCSRRQLGLVIGFAYCFIIWSTSSGSSKDSAIIKLN